MTIDRNVDINGVTFAVVVETEHPTKTHGTLLARTAVHEHQFDRRIGGVRFVPGAPDDRTEVGELAEAMTWKSALAALPADGQKSVVYCPEGIAGLDESEMAAVLAEHLAELKVADPGVIFGPDINCGEQVMDLVAHRHREGDHVSGLLEGQGGLSIDRYGYTGRGLQAALLAAAGTLGWDLSSMSASIQGFGAVGAHVAKNLKSHGVSIRAVSTYHGALIAETAEGLDVDRLFELWLPTQKDEFFKQFQDSSPAGSRWAHRDSLFTEKADIFIPAARTDVLGMPDELAGQKRADVQRFAEATGVKVILEGANHPLTAAAEKYMESRGVFILPDYLVNCGGLIGCWADWVYRRELEGTDKATWYQRLNDSASNYTAKVVEQNVPKMLAATGNRPQGLREAAHRLAKELRMELQAKFAAYRSTNPNGDDGRDFARRSMDDLLK